MPKVIEPTPIQIRNCKSLGWEYLGDGLFEKDGMIGWFSDRGFEKE